MMTKENLQTEYCNEYGYEVFNKYNNSNYTKFLESKIISQDKDNKKKFPDHRNPPLPPPPLNRVMKEGVTDFCTSCGSTVTKNGWFGVLGEKLCNNKKCKNSLTRIK